jgi:biopolymer transport protein ExbD
MEMRSSRNKRALILNVLPLIDVLFLLLIFFMISTTFLSQPAIKLELPEAAHSETVRQAPVVIYIDPSERVYLNDEPVEIPLLGEALRRQMEGDDDKSVSFKADSRVSHGRVVEVLDVIKGAGIQKISFGTQQPEK